jgi:hypothetical protein
MQLTVAFTLVSESKVGEESCKTLTLPLLQIVSNVSERQAGTADLAVQEPGSSNWSECRFHQRGRKLSRRDRVKR